MTRQATSIEQLGDQLVIGLDNLVLDAQGNAIVCEDGGQGKFVCFRVCFRAKYKLIFAFVDAPNRMFLLRQAGGPPGNDLINQNTIMIFGQSKTHSVAQASVVLACDMRDSIVCPCDICFIGTDLDIIGIEYGDFGFFL